MKNKTHLSKSIYRTFPALLILLTIYTMVVPESARAQDSPQSKIEAARADTFDAKFYEGRNLLDKQEWSRAADKFREAVDKYPDDKSADAALYWLAFCYKKQKRFKEANGALNRLLEKFPASSWTGDAQVMKMEIGSSLGRFSDSERTGVNSDINSALQKGKFPGGAQTNGVKTATTKPGQNMKVADEPGESGRVALDRVDEIKIAAFQSLLTADPKRAIEIMGELLKPDSEASEILKQEILRLWRNPRLFASQTLTSNIIRGIGEKQFAFLLRETLVKSFRNETNLKIRREIIYTLAALADAEAIDYLKKLYAAETDREVKKAIINSFGSSANEFYPFYSGVSQKPKAEPDLAREQTRKIELDVLLEIIRAEKDSELRRLAFSNLRRFQNWTASEQSIDVMSSLYDAESDEEFKLAIIGALIESKQSRAVRKLLDIAGNDKSDKLRLEAIYSLRTSRDPEVLKFLEDLIK